MFCDVLQFSQVDLGAKASSGKTLYPVQKIGNSLLATRKPRKPISSNRENVIIGWKRGASKRILFLALLIRRSTNSAK